MAAVGAGLDVENGTILEIGSEQRTEGTNSTEEGNKVYADIDDDFKEEEKSKKVHLSD